MQGAYTACEALVRAGDRDRFLASLFAPSEHRPALLALYAFNLEIARIHELVRQPLAGEIRLQWWRDPCMLKSYGEAQGHPVAARSTAAITNYGLATASDCRRLIGCVQVHLYNEPMGALADFDGLCGRRCRWAHCRLVPRFSHDGR